MFSQVETCTIPVDLPPQLMVVIDTEEEFDWSEPVQRHNTSVKHMELLERVQHIFQQYGLVPCYVVDYPVATQAVAQEPLRYYAAKGQCEIGAHLHPWVNPPLTEALIPANTYPGNLEPALELAKMRVLKDTIDNQFQQQTTIYKAGRYGLGPHTAANLLSLGFDTDVSVCPPMDFRGDGGPDYRHASQQPYWSMGRQLLTLPSSGAFVGSAGRYSAALHEAAQRFKPWKVPAICSRLGLVDRLMLSPEGFTTAEHIKLTQHLLAQGCRLFTWSFHSPSIEPGHTVYVQNDRQLQAFLDKFYRFFDYFFHTLQGQATTPSQVRHMLKEQA